MRMLLATIPLTQQVGDEQFNAALALVWIVVGALAVAIVWPGGRGRRILRQMSALSVLAFREGVRLKVLWTVFALSLIPGALAYFSDGDGTHAGRAQLIVGICLSVGEVLGAALIVLLCALSVSREIESRVMYTLGTKPVPRWSILMGKALGFWFVDLLFLAGLVFFTALLVRAVPLRAETRVESKLVSSGTWADLRRNALCTRHFYIPDGEVEGPISGQFIRPGKSADWKFTLDPAALHGEPLALRLQLSSTASYESHIRDMHLKVAFENQPPLFDRSITIVRDRPLQMYFDAQTLAQPGILTVSIGAPDLGKFSPSIIALRPHGVRVGLFADGLARNLGKAWLLMGLQGWILAIITTGWSGILSFPVTVALGLLLLMGGELSRQALDLLQSSVPKGSAAETAQVTSSAFVAYVRLVIGLLPDFRAAGGPSAFVEGTFLSAWSLAHAALWMGLIRGLGWAIPGAVLFQRREVGG